MDLDGEWHDCVAWEVPGSSIHWHTLSDFHNVHTSALWQSFKTSSSSTTGRSLLWKNELMEVVNAFEQVGNGEEDQSRVLGVVLGTHEVLGKCVGVELLEQQGALFFVTSIELECSDAQTLAWLQKQTRREQADGVKRLGLTFQNIGELLGGSLIYRALTYNIFLLIY
eukprot:2908763-Rhodomonas_salina.4